jgi:hypothetical protein
VGSIERNLNPTPPDLPTLEREKTPEPTAPPAFLPFQEPTPATIPTTELFPRDPVVSQEQLFDDTQTWDIFEEVTLGNYDDTVFGPLRRAIEQSQGPPLSGTLAEQIEQIMGNAMGNTAVRYPWILNASDNLSFAPLLFKPKSNEVFTELDLRWTEDNPVVNQITLGGFPYKHQFYWVLPGNRIVMETSGGQGGILYQGLEKEVDLLQTLTQAQSYTGYQAVWVIPNDLQTLFKPEELQDYTVVSIGGQVVNESGASAGPVTINSDAFLGNGEDVVYLPSPNNTIESQLGTGSTLNPKGGGSLFNNLEVENAPLLLQGFPTTDLRPLAGVELKNGGVVSKEKLAAAGITFADVLIGQPGQFNAPISSLPGIKIGQGERFDNPNLLNVLINPYLTEAERDYHYLNSLLWISTGVRPPDLALRQVREEETNWYRLYMGIPHNRVMLQYSTDSVEATYSSLYSSPGISITVPPEGGDIDWTQSANASIGMLVGSIFEAFNLENLNESLDEAKDERDAEKLFAPLQTKATPEERKKINQRLNSALAYANLGSSLNQVSGYVTFPTVINPTESTVFQIKTGNLKRAVQFLENQVGDWQEGDTVFANARFSNRTFGGLSFLEGFLPVRPSYTDGQNPNNEAAASQVILISPDGKRYVQDFNSETENLSAVPTPINTYDITYDRFVLQRTDRRTITNDYFNGFLYLPTLEFALAGTSEDLNYALNTGVWFNIDRRSAPGVEDNNLGIQEPTVGGYVNAILSATTTTLQLDENNQLEAIHSSVPFLRFNWNTANNGNNPWQITAAYTFSRQTRSYGISLTSSLGYIPQYSNGPLIGLFSGKLGLSFGLSLNGNVELGDTTYYSVDLLQEIIPELAIGPYLSNYTDINLGFNSRLLGTNYGGIIQYQLTDSPVTLTVRLGTGPNGFDGSVKGGIRF